MDEGDDDDDDDEYFLKICRETQISLKSDKNNTSLYEDQFTFLYISLNSS